MRYSHEPVAHILPRPDRIDLAAVFASARPRLEDIGVLALVAVFWGLLLYGAFVYAFP
ncbi:MAG TPA: hypothetical protein VFA78_06350 [Chloroflexota bacterium]|nr:hypothetical protein [Chloroflexota bacterium]